MPDNEQEEQPQGKVCPDCGKVHPILTQEQKRAMLAQALSAILERREQGEDKEESEEQEQEAKPEGDSGFAVFEVNTRTDEITQVKGDKIPDKLRKRVHKLVKEAAEEQLIKEADDPDSTIHGALAEVEKTLHSAMPLVMQNLKQESVARVVLKLALLHRELVFDEGEKRVNRTPCLSWGMLMVRVTQALNECYRLRGMLESAGINPDPQGTPADFLRTRPVNPPAE